MQNGKLMQAYNDKKNCLMIVINKIYTCAIMTESMEMFHQQRNTGVVKIMYQQVILPVSVSGPIENT